MHRRKLWTNIFISTTIVHFSLFLSMYLLVVTMASYVIETYNTSTSLAGFVASSFIIGVLFGRLFSGYIMGIINPKKVLIFGIVIFVILSFFYFPINSVYSLLIVRIIQGVGTGIATTATITIVSQDLPRNRYGEGIGYFSLSVVLSTAIGPLIGVNLLKFYSYNSILVFSLIMGIISLFLTVFIKSENIIKYSVKKEDLSEKKELLDKFFEPTAIPIAIIMLVVAFAYSGLLSFIVPFSQEINLPTAGGYYFLVFAIVILFTRPVVGKIMDFKGPDSVIYPSLTLFIVALILISQSTTTFVFLLGTVFVGLGYGNFQSSAQALSIKYTPIHNMRLANATYFIFLDISLGIGPLIIGHFISIYGYRNIYLFLTVFVFIGMVLYYFFYGTKKRFFSAKR